MGGRGKYHLRLPFLVFDKAYPEHCDLRPFCISDFSLYRASQNQKDEAPNFPTYGVRLEPARKAPVSIRSDALATQPLALLPSPHLALFHTKRIWG